MAMGDHGAGSPALLTENLAEALNKHISKVYTAPSLRVLNAWRRNRLVVQKDSCPRPSGRI